MDAIQTLLQNLELPVGDRHDLPGSQRRFPDGAHYRIEIASVEGPAALAAIVEAGQQYGVTVHRVSQGSGIMLLQDAEIATLAQLGHAHGMEVCLFVGPRAPWEGTAQALTPEGKLLGWRHTGMDQLVYGLRDVQRAASLGIRSVLVADEGLIWLIDQARRQGLLPEHLTIKASALLGVANPVGIRLLVAHGVSTINVASDISLARLAALRQVIDIPIDLYIESPDGLGGFTRYHELAEIVRVAAPVYLKFGLKNAVNLYPSGTHLEAIAVQTGRERVRRAAIALEHLARADGDLRSSMPFAAGISLPEPPQHT
jgi:hypothetical protein